MNRDDLPAEPVAAIAEVDRRADQLAAQQQHLALLRGQVIRELVGNGRGGKQRAAAALGVSWTQVQRTLGEDVARRVRAALAGWSRTDYDLRVVGDHAVVSLSLEVLEGSTGAAANAANALVSDLRAAGLEASADGRAVDTDGFGPCGALARGDDVEVHWADETGRRPT